MPVLHKAYNTDRVIISALRRQHLYSVSPVHFSRYATGHNTTPWGAATLTTLSPHSRLVIKSPHQRNALLHDKMRLSIGIGMATARSCYRRWFKKRLSRAQAAVDSAIWRWFTLCGLYRNAASTLLMLLMIYVAAFYSQYQEAAPDYRHSATRPHAFSAYDDLSSRYGAYINRRNRKNAHAEGLLNWTRLRNSSITRKRDGCMRTVAPLISLLEYYPRRKM